MQTIPPVNNRPAGMTGFSIVFVGQLITVIATQMANFALILWIYEKKGSASALGLTQVFF
jgi:DHA3 family macrolide efflux protein-like MFS transporter